MSRTFLFSALIFMQAFSGTLVGADTKAPSKKSESKKEVQQKKAAVKWAVIEIKGTYPEGPQTPGLFSNIVESLPKLKERLEKAANDSSLEGVILKIQSPQIGWAQVSEISGSISKVKKAGKKVYAFLEQAMTMDYLLASHCDKIIMPETGMVFIPGIRAEVTFFKNMLDKLDMQADIVRVGKYKSAAESLTRTEMSPEFREELTALLDDHYESLINTIAKNRGMDTKKVETTIDLAPFLVADANQHGLVDSIGYYDELISLIEKKNEGGKPEFVKSYGKKKRDTNFSGLAGMVKMMNLMMGVEPRKKKSNAPKIAIIHAEGMIVTGKSTESMFAGKIMGSTTIVKAINKASQDKNVKAIVLRVNSGGGSALASDLMWRALEKVDKPVVVSMGSVAASGGYYISMGADYIFSEPTTVTGSIGVISLKIAFKGLYNKLGMTTEVISRGKNSGVLSALDKFNDSEKKAMARLSDGFYAIFTEKAAKGRKMSVKQIHELAQGRIYSGTRAKKIGLVDELGSLDDAIAHAKKLAGIKPDDKIQKMILPKATSPFEQLFGPIDADARAVSMLGKSISSVLNMVDRGLLEKMDILTFINIMTKESCMAVMPFHLSIK
jgi:protease IV